jgi:PEP-CTERM motif
MKIRNFPRLSTWLLLSMGAIPGAMATPIACPTTGTYQDLLNTDAAGGCTISLGGGASLTFSDFTFTPAGVGTPTAAGMGYTLDDPGMGPGGVPIFGFEFNPGLAVTGTTATPDAIQDVLLTYLIVPSGTAITSADLLENAAATGAGVGQVSEDLMFCLASDPNNTSGTCRTFPPLLVTTVGGVLQDVANFAPWTSMTVSKDISASSGAVGGTATISQVRDAVDVTVSAVPEPATFSLLAVGLLACGYLARRRTA